MGFYGISVWLPSNPSRICTRHACSPEVPAWPTLLSISWWEETVEWSDATHFPRKHCCFGILEHFLCDETPRKAGRWVSCHPTSYVWMSMHAIAAAHDEPEEVRLVHHSVSADGHGTWWLITSWRSWERRWIVEVVECVNVCAIAAVHDEPEVSLT